MRGRGGCAVATVALALVALGCGGSEIDSGQAEQAIRSGLERQTGVDIASVRCPDDVEAKRGRRFRCTAVAAGGRRAEVVVTVRDDDGTIAWRVAPPR